MNHYTPGAIGEGTSVPQNEKSPYEITSDHECPHCMSQSSKRIYGPHRGGHYAKIVCSNCDRFIKWEPQPKPETSGKKRKNQKELLAQHSQGFCEICLRRSHEIPSPQTLEVHHIVEVQNGGTDDSNNLQIVCTQCHKWIHHQRVYLGHYRTSTTPEPDAERQSIYDRIPVVMRERGITKRSAIAVLNSRFEKSTRDELSTAELKEFLAILERGDNGAIGGES